MIFQSLPTPTAVPAWTSQAFCPHISISSVFILVTPWRGMEETAVGATSQIKPHSFPREATADAPGLSCPDTTSKPEDYSTLRAWILLPSWLLLTDEEWEQLPPSSQHRKAVPAHTHTFAARERQQRNGFSGSSLHLFIFILSLTDEQRNGFGFPGCHKPRNILMKNKCIYRETSKQPKTSQSNVPVLGKSAFISLPLHGLRADHAVERDKYFK